MYPNYFLYPFLMPFIPPTNEQPITLYALLNSLVNYGKEEKTKIRNLARVGHSKIFDFEYPLSSNINKSDFETLILNHFIKRRIGYQTVTDFQIHLETKMNEIMPFYNKMFDALENWEIFNDGEVTTKTGTDNRIQNSSNSSSNSLHNQSTNTTQTTNDRRNSELPQSQIQNVQNASYLTDYTLDQNNGSSTDNSTATGTASSNTQATDNNTYNETVTRTPADKIAILKEMQENIQKIYTMIFKDLDCLFYQLI